MCGYLCVCVRVCVCACVRACVCARTWVYACVCVQECMPACVCMHMCVSLCVCVYMCAGGHTHVCVCVYIYICMHVYTWNNSISYIRTHRFLTDLMDQADLIRNVVLAGHLHHGKVFSITLPPVVMTLILIIEHLC